MPDPDEGKDPAAVSLGRRGGLKGGKARAAKLTLMVPSGSCYKCDKCGATSDCS